MQGPQLMVVLVALVVVGGDARSTPVQWPEMGLEMSQEQKDEDFKQSSAACFTRAGSNFTLVKECVKIWLPNSVAACSDIAFSNIMAFNKCVSIRHRQQRMRDHRMEVVYEKGSKFLKRILRTEPAKQSAAGLFSSYAEKILLLDEDIKELLKEDVDCKNRFGLTETGDRSVEQQTSQAARISKTLTEAAVPLAEESNIVYQYGMVGHTMPFHGVGPLAKAVLAGKCRLHYLEDVGTLQKLVNIIIQRLMPVPGWWFDEMAKKAPFIEV